MTTLLNPTEYELMDSDIPPTLFGFDLDSVLSDTSYLVPGICRVLDVPIEALDQTGFKYAVEGVSNNTMYKAIHQIVYEEGPSSLPTPFMQEVLHYYHNMTDDPIVVVTARHKMSFERTIDWLEENLARHGIPYHCVVVHNEPKLPVLLELGVDYFVDDRYKTIAGLQGYIDHPVIYERPWNIGRKRDASSLKIRDLRDLIPLFNIECGLPPATWPGNIPYPDRIGRGKLVDLYA